MSIRTAPLALVAVLALAGCRSRLPTEPASDVALVNGFRARAESSIGPGPADDGVIMTRVMITNAGPSTSSITLGASCTVELRIYRVGGTAAPIYDETPEICTLPARILTLSPGAADTIARQVPLTTLQGQATGRLSFRVEALLSVAGGTTARVDGRVLVPAGTVTIQ